jgi:hypothetical protein
MEYYRGLMARVVQSLIQVLLKQVSVKCELHCEMYVA